MTNDHKLGNPAAALAAAEAEERARDPYTYLRCESMYPLGAPVRVVEAWHATMAALEAPDEIDKFNEGDHKPDGTVAEGVTDDEILRNVSRNMAQLHGQAELRTFYMALCDRLKPMRSRELVKKVGTVYGIHVARVTDSDRQKKSSVNPYSLTSAVLSAAGLGGNPFVPQAAPVEYVTREQLAKDAVAAWALYRDQPATGITFMTGKQLGD